MVSFIIKFTLNYSKKQRLSWLKTHIHDTAHWENVKDVLAARKYCAKTDTRIKGPWNNIPIPMKNVIPIYQRDAEFVNNMRPWQAYLKEMLLHTTPDDRTIHVIVDEGGLGKSRFPVTINAVYGKASRRPLALAMLMRSTLWCSSTAVLMSALLAVVQ